MHKGHLLNAGETRCRPFTHSVRMLFEGRLLHVFGFPYISGVVSVLCISPRHYSSSFCGSHNDRPYALYRNLTNPYSSSVELRVLPQHRASALKVPINIFARTFYLGRAAGWNFLSCEYRKLSRAVSLASIYAEYMANFIYTFFPPQNARCDVQHLMLSAST